MTKLRATFITMFREPLAAWLSSSIVGRAHQRGILQSQVLSILESVSFNHHAVDDTPYGGGPGELMKIDVIAPLVESALALNGERSRKNKRVLLMDPAGALFNHNHAKRLAQYEELIFVCGRYEGIDARIYHFVDEAISIGDYVLSCGDLAAMAIFDATSRLIEGVLGNSQSSVLESHLAGRLESSQYTRPPVYRSYLVPEVLQNGNHQAIMKARLQESIYKTHALRPDLIDSYPLTDDERAALIAARQQSYPWDKTP